MQVRLAYLVETYFSIVVHDEHDDPGTQTSLDRHPFPLCVCFIPTGLRTAQTCVTQHLVTGREGDDVEDSSLKAGLSALFHKTQSIREVVLY